MHSAFALAHVCATAPLRLTRTRLECLHFVGCCGLPVAAKQTEQFMCIGFSRSHSVLSTEHMVGPAPAIRRLQHAKPTAGAGRAPILAINLCVLTCTSLSQTLKFGGILV